MSHDNLPYISHMLDAIKDIEDSVKNDTKDQFIKNKDIKDATIRRIEIIGEAAKNIQESFKKNHAEISWKEIIGTRDRMIHHYFGVNLDIVWEIIKTDLPTLKKQLQGIKKDLEKYNGIK